MGLEQNAAYLILRGLKTLSIRVRQQNATALKLARTLEAHPKVDFAFQPLKHESAACFVSPIFCILDSLSLGLLWSPRAQFTPVLYLQVVNSGFYDVS
jgi:hypothetical protein